MRGSFGPHPPVTRQNPIWLWRFSESRLVGEFGGKDCHLIAWRSAEYQTCEGKIASGVSRDAQYRSRFRSQDGKRKWGHEVGILIHQPEENRLGSSGRNELGQINILIISPGSPDGCTGRNKPHVCLQRSIGRSASRCARAENHQRQAGREEASATADRTQFGEAGAEPPTAIQLPNLGRSSLLQNSHSIFRV